MCMCSLIHYVTLLVNNNSTSFYLRCFERTHGKVTESLLRKLTTHVISVTADRTITISVSLCGVFFKENKKRRVLFGVF